MHLNHSALLLALPLSTLQLLLLILPLPIFKSPHSRSLLRSSKTQIFQFLFPSFNVIYQAVIKNGHREYALARANSAIRGGVRTKLTKPSSINSSLRSVAARLRPALYPRLTHSGMRFAASPSTFRVPQATLKTRLYGDFRKFVQEALGQLLPLGKQQRKPAYT